MADGANWYDYPYSHHVKSHHVAIFVVVVIVVIFLIHFRQRIAAWHDRFRTRRRMRYARLHDNLGGFELDVENGLSSANFDLQSNIDNASDTRSGLLESAAQEIRHIMEEEHVSFDEARLRYFNMELAENGIGADGVPTDRKTVTFSL